MAVREILKMGDPRLLRVAKPIQAFNTAALQALLQDMRDTMAAANGAGLAAPQIGEDVQLVIFGSGQVNPRYPDAPPVPPTVLINPTITPIFESNQPLALINAAPSAHDLIAFDVNFQAAPEALEEAWEGCLSVPGLRGVVPRFKKIRYQGFDETG
jgi:peptide deformylase